MIKPTDSVIHEKGNTKLLMNQNGDLVKLQSDGTRTALPKSDQDTKYFAGDGLQMDATHTFAIDYNDTNTSGKLCKIGEDGKIPSSLYEFGNNVMVPGQTLIFY